MIEPPAISASEIVREAAALRRSLRTGFREEVVASLYGEVERITRRAVRDSGARPLELDQQIDRIVTSRLFGLPLMVGLLAVVFWLTIVGANVPSQLLATAFFWFESEPMWNDIARSVIERQALDPWRAARILALVNFAVADGCIASFEAKYRFRFWRPYTAVRSAADDGNDGTAAEPGWVPLLWTPPGMPPKFLIPPIPDYPSTAAVTSAAAAAVLRVHLGEPAHRRLRRQG